MFARCAFVFVIGLGWFSFCLFGNFFNVLGVCFGFMELLDFYVSPDGCIDEIVGRGEDCVSAVVRVGFPDLEGYFDGFAEDVGRGDWFLSGRSRIARFGFNFASEGAPVVDERGRSLSFLVGIVPFMQDYVLDGWQDWLFSEGDPVLRVRRAVGERVGVEELEAKRRLGKVRFPSGFCFSGDYDVRLPVKGVVSRHASGRLTGEYLARAVSGDLGREYMDLFQVPVEGGVVVPAGGGALAHARVRFGGYSAVVKREQDGGVRSASGFVDANSSESLYLAFEGGGVEDVGLDSAVVSVLRSDVRVVDGSFSDLRFSLDFGKRTGSSPVYVSKGDSVGLLCRVDHKDREDVKSFSSSVDSLSSGSHAVYFDEFPSESVLSVVERASIDDKIGSLSFKRLPRSETGFTAGEVSRLRHLADLGVEVCWDVEPWGERRFFYKAGFMVKEMIPVFDKALKSNSVAAVFGSAGVYQQDRDYRRLLEIISGFKDFVGGEGFVFNGGGPAVMSASSEITREQGLYVGNSSIVIPDEVSSFEDVYRADVVLPYHFSHINTRQEQLFQASSVRFFYDPAGVGTASEFFEAETREKLYRKGNPIFVIGSDDSFIVQVAKTLKFGRAQGTLPERLVDPHNTYVMPDGRGVYGKLIEHYGFERVDRPSDKTKL